MVGYGKIQLLTKQRLSDATAVRQTLDINASAMLIKKCPTQLRDDIKTVIRRLLYETPHRERGYSVYASHCMRPSMRGLASK